VDLTITTTAKGQHGKLATKTSEVVHTTSEHPFFTAEQGFVSAGKVKLGMHVLRADGSVGLITGWKVVPGTQVMYNLEVANDHTFTVGAGQWVVHNRCDFPFLANELAKSLAEAAFQDTHPTISVAFGLDAEGNISTLVGINSSTRRPWRIKELEALLGEEGIIVPTAEEDAVKKEFHAEQNILAYMRANDLELLGIGASRAICLEICVPAILNYSGGNMAVIGSPISMKVGNRRIIVWSPDW
jgi:hypothetical protein